MSFLERIEQQRFQVYRERRTVYSGDGFALRAYMLAILGVLGLK